MSIDDLNQRLTALEESLAAAAAGTFQPIGVDHDDALAAVEYGVNIVMQDLNEEIDRATKNERELQAKLEEITAQKELIQRQRETILKLSTPVLQLWDHILVMPIIGVLDSDRANDVSDRLLQMIHSGSVRFVLLDVTGIELVDTDTAAHLTRVVQAARLLGVQCMLTGVQPAVALTMVSLGLDISEVQTHRNLKQGLTACLQSMGDIE